MRINASTEAEWVAIAPDKIVVATAEKVWLESSFANSDRYAQSLVCVGSPAITSNLLDGAMAAAKIAVPQGQKPPALTLDRLVWQLVGAYHIAHVTPIFMQEASQRFALASRQTLSDWAAEKAEEETGHDRLALLDIRSLGYQAEQLVESIVPSAAKALVDYFQRSVQDADPIDCVGYAYALERMSLGAKAEHIQQVQDLLPPGVNATRCLKVHSSLGGDAEHVGDNIELIARLSPAERDRIVRACYETTLMLFSPPVEGYWSESELEAMFKPYKLAG